MDSNITDKNSKSIRSIVSIMGMLLLIAGMVYSVKTEKHIVTTMMMIIGSMIILVAEKTKLNERDN